MQGWRRETGMCSFAGYAAQGARTARTEFSLRQQAWAAGMGCSMARRWAAGSLLAAACLAVSCTAELSVGPAFLWTAAGSVKSSPEPLASRTEYRVLQQADDLAALLLRAGACAEPVWLCRRPAWTTWLSWLAT